jgi:dolichyl-phosphate-mannose-protein mannosyltransferase
MSRQLMLHNYLPGHLASTLVAGSIIQIIDLTLQKPKEKGSRHEKEAQITQPPKEVDDDAGSGSSYVAWTACVVVLSATFVFWYFWLPLTYGNPGLSTEAVRQRELFGIRLLYADENIKYDCWA